MQNLSFSRGVPVDSAPSRPALQAPRAVQFTIPWQSKDHKQRSISRGPSLAPYTAPKRRRQPAIPPPRRRTVARPGWNDDVKQGVYFDQALAKTKMFNAPKKHRDMVEHKSVLSASQPRASVSLTYAPTKQNKAALPTKSKPAIPPPRASRSSAPRSSTTPPAAPNRPVPSATIPTGPNSQTSTAFIAPLSSSSSHIIEPSSASFLSPSESTAMENLRRNIPDRTSPPSPSPVLGSANQEDKDDHIAFPSFPPPPSSQMFSLSQEQQSSTAPTTITLNVPLIQSTFRAMDLKRKGTLHAREIHQGLQLLGIATTMRQIADYLYLVNDGQGDTIDIHDWTTLVQTLQSSAWRRIQDMFGRAEAAVATRWNNQQSTTANDNPPTEFLRRAASVVHGFKSSLYPLVHQADETLRAIQERHAGGHLSLILSRHELALVAHHAEDFCDLLVDDLLLDAAVSLTDTEQAKARYATERTKRQQLHDLLAMINEIEAMEDAVATALSHPRSTNYDEAATPCKLSLAVAAAADQLTTDMPITKSSKPIDLETFTDPLARWEQRTVCTSNVAPIAESLEKHRQAFLRCRRIAEASLVDTGMAQPVVIELLEGMLVDDLVDALVVELDNCFHTLSDKIVHTV
ncbi:hypothetical protein H257_04737 [Aphanomyces astaci]|uniref:EF-hand domain-containing protein n=1 Tax=Aphanomyces astaci TaxID=112090 RepID=W4GVN5_APHAT|nr:hypothetical protein H257_04737 [Aphanomyces astaci]ETV82983.1 hypothetical protein H257_04737 [Aphanomyces astaci]|eukprot:XP_009827654.1 hypothetical protein H257_04737 [Aphanomyces astaci]